MPLFTVLMEFEGTTSPSQFTARDVEQAFKKWLKGLHKPNRYGLTERQRLRVVKGAEDTPYMAASLLSGLQNVWCVTLLAKRGGLVLLNIVQTEAAKRAFAG